MFDDSGTPFIWSGNTGARLTPDEIVQQRKDAAALVQQGTDQNMFAPGTRGAGVWTQGLAHVAKALEGGLEAREADQAAKQNADDSKAAIATLLGGGSASVTPTATATSTATPGPIPDYITSAATKYGVDPAYLAHTAQIESGMNPNNVNPTSGAAGLFQFVPSTAKQYGLSNPMDPAASADAAARLTADNTKALTAALGRAPTPGELYLAHQQGADGAAKLILNPNAPAVSSVGLGAVMNNGGAQSMTGRQFANMWTGRFPGAAPAQPAPYTVASAGPNVPVPAPVAPGVAKVAAAMPAAAVPATASVKASDDDEEDTPAPAAAASTPTPAVANVATAPPAPAPASPGVAKVTAAMPTALASPTMGTARVQAALQAYTSPYTDAQTKQLASMVIQQAMKPQASGVYSDPNLGMVQKAPDGTIHILQPPHAQAPYKDADGNLLQTGADGTVHAVIQADKDPTSVKEYNFYKSQLPPGQPAMPYDQWSTAKARAAATNVTTNVDTKPSQTYSSTMAEGLAKSHSALANGVEDAQARARDIAAMQGAIDAIQKNGGSTGGLAPEQQLYLQKSINAGAAALGIEKPFSESDLSDKEFLTKFNRSMAGAQAKNAVGSRVTNFELQNFLKANPGIDMTITGNQRLLGIQSQIEQRNIAVGNAIRDATAQAMTQGKDVSPVTVQKIITDYDQAHHIKDPVTGQDLTQSYVLPEFQTGGTNAGLAAQHTQNIAPMRRTTNGVQWSVQ